MPPRGPPRSSWARGGTGAKREVVWSWSEATLHLWDVRVLDSTVSSISGEIENARNGCARVISAFGRERLRRRSSPRTGANIPLVASARDEPSHLCSAQPRVCMGPRVAASTQGDRVSAEVAERLCFLSKTNGSDTCDRNTCSHQGLSEKGVAASYTVNMRFAIIQSLLWSYRSYWWLVGVIGTLARPFLDVSSATTGVRSVITSTRALPVEGKSLLLNSSSEHGFCYKMDWSYQFSF